MYDDAEEEEGGGENGHVNGGHDGRGDEQEKIECRQGSQCAAECGSFGDRIWTRTKACNIF
jgi:hypothetical protein